MGLRAMTAWTQLVAGSTLESGTAWQHLGAQGGASSGVYIASGMSAEIAESGLSGWLRSDAISCDILGKVSATLEQRVLEGNLDG